MTNHPRSTSQSGFSVLVPDGESNFFLPVINCLSQIPGIKIHILSNIRVTPSRFSAHRGKFIFRKPARSEQEWIDNIQQAVKQTGADILLPLDQPVIRTLAKYKELLGTTVTPLPDVKSFDIAVNKRLLSNFLQEHNLPTPSTITYENNDQLEDLIRLHFPVLTKPVDGKGGQGIKFWESPLELQTYLGEYGRPNQFVIQSFLSGHVAGCNVLCREGKILAYTAQIGLSSPRFSFGHAEDIRIIDNPQIFKIVKRLMTSLNWSGLANIDLYYDKQDQDYKILEINPRYWGTLLGSLNAGVNFPYLACLAGLGYEFSLPAYASKPYLGGKGIFQLLIPNLLQRSDPSININNSAIKYFLSDPIPMLTRWFFKFFGWLSKVWHKIWG